jgi:hypothetical protein
MRHQCLKHMPAFSAQELHGSVLSSRRHVPPSGTLPFFLLALLGPTPPSSIADAASAASQPVAIIRDSSPPFKGVAQVFAAAQELEPLHTNYERLRTRVCPRACLQKRPVRQRSLATTGFAPKVAGDSKVILLNLKSSGCKMPYTQQGRFILILPPHHLRAGFSFFAVGTRPVVCYDDSSSCWRLLAHLASAAFLAIADLCSGVSFSARALPPFIQHRDGLLHD